MLGLCAEAGLDCVVRRLGKRGSNGNLIGTFTGIIWVMNNPNLIFLSSLSGLVFEKGLVNPNS